MSADPSQDKLVSPGDLSGDAGDDTAAWVLAAAVDGEEHEHLTLVYASDVTAGAVVSARRKLAPSKRRERRERA